MNQTQAVNVLIQAANKAQNTGAFDLQEAAIVAQAVAAFTTSSETTDLTANEDAEEAQSNDD
jgi:hypothetical protein